ncbi:MAG: hypothetical protein SVX43_10945 [Cyanobacteriota bacterium]|nr:hypothetical protein [Cyanobacteriota bacterium]
MGLLGVAHCVGVEFGEFAALDAGLGLLLLELYASGDDLLALDVVLDSQIDSIEVNALCLGYLVVELEVFLDELDGDRPVSLGLGILTAVFRVRGMGYTPSCDAPGGNRGGFFVRGWLA